MTTAEPLYFASNGRPCLAWLHATRAAADTAVLICAPVGYEMVCAHRVMRVLSEHLAAAGVSAMRFDYEGVGDSEGSESDLGRVAGWVSSIREAERTLRERTGATRVVVVAIRVGAALALEALPDMPHVSAMVLIAPLSGPTFVRELQAFAKLGSAPDELEWTDEGAQVAGYWMSSDTLDGLRQLGKRHEARSDVRTLLIPRDDIAGDDPRTLAQLTRYGITPEIRNVAGYQMLMRDPHKTELSPGIASAVVGFCTQDLQSSSPVSREVSPTSKRQVSTKIRVGGGVVEETVLSVGPGLVGVRTNPLSGPKSGTPLVVMLNPGAVHHIGVNRSHVILARQLALRGTCSIRIDLEGLGDSATGEEPVAPRLYSTRSLQSLVTTLGNLRQERSIVVVGLCAGAYAAYHAALQHQVDGLILINPQTFSFKEGDPLDVPTTRAVYRDAANVRQSMLELSSWKRLMQGQVDVARSVRVVANRGWLFVRTRGEQLLTRFGAIPTSEIERKLRRLSEAHTRTFFVFSKDDPGFAYLDETLNGRMRVLVDDKVFALCTIDRADHTFTPRGTQDELLANMTKWLSSSFNV